MLQGPHASPQHRALRKPHVGSYRRLAMTAVQVAILVFAHSRLGAQGSPDLRVQVERGTDGSIGLTWSPLGPSFIYEVESTTALHHGWQATMSPADSWPLVGTNWTGLSASGDKARFFRVRATDLVGQTGELSPLDYVPGEVLAMLAPDATTAAVAARHALEVREEVVLEALELKTARFGVPGGTLLENVLIALGADPDVMAVSRNRIVRSQQAAYNDTLWNGQHGFFQIRADMAHTVATGRGVKVAVIDSGLDLGHPEFAGRVLREDCFDAVNGDSAFSDLSSGHGTHVAGTIAARAGNGEGVVGVAPEAELIIARSGGPSHATMDVVKCLDFAVSRGARVINMSLGLAMDTPDSDLFARMYEQITIDAAVRKGATVVVSAMNDQQRGSPYALPGLLPNVIAVGAVDPEGQVAPFSNLRPYVDVAAPGVDILSTFPRHLGDESGYARKPGTSMAAPHVAGVAALMLEVNPDLSPCAVQAILERTAVDLGAPGKDPRYGSGLVDAYAAVLEAEQLVSDPGRLDGCCDLALVSGSEAADVQALRIDASEGAAEAWRLNANSAPWQTATSIAVDEGGRLYVTAQGGAGAGLYRLEIDGTLKPLSIGAPFEAPAGVTVDREGNAVIVDRASRRILRVNPVGDVVILHEGDPLIEPTGIAYAEMADRFIVSDASGPAGEGHGGVFLFQSQSRTFTRILTNSWDFQDVVSHVPNNILFAAVAPMADDPRGALVFASHTQPESAIEFPADLDPTSDEYWTGIGRGFAGEFWITDAEAPEGNISFFSVTDGQLQGRTLPATGVDKPVDIAQAPPRRLTIAPPEFIHLTCEPTFLASPGQQARLSIVGKRSNDEWVSAEALRANDEIVLESIDDTVAAVDADGLITAIGTGVTFIQVRWSELETLALVAVGATGLSIYHPETSLSDAGFGDFEVRAGDDPILIKVYLLFEDGRSITLPEQLAQNVYATGNNLAVTVGAGAAAGWLHFPRAGASRLTVYQCPFSASIDITVQGASPVSLNGLDPVTDPITLRVGETRELEVRKLFSDGSNSALDNIASGNEFSSADSAVAKVGFLTGAVTGVTPGETTVTVTNTDLETTFSVTVLPGNEPPNGVIVSPSLDVTRHVGAGITFRALAYDSDGSVLHTYWSFAGATTNRFGKDTGPVGFLTPGEYPVTFFACDDELATDPTPPSRRITILPAEVVLESLEIAEGDFELNEGRSEQLTVLGHYSDGSSHYLSASMSRTKYGTTDGSIATVSTQGLVTGVSEGVATITATNGSYSASAVVTVIPPPPTLTSLEIVNDDLEFDEFAASEQLQVIGHYSDGSEKNLTSVLSGTTYTSSHPEIASVSAGGVVVAFTTGTAVITARHENRSDSVLATVEIDVLPAPTISGQIVSETLQQGDTTYFYWQATDATHVVIEPGIGVAVPTGMVPIMPQETTTYTATAYGPGGSASGSITVEVIPTPALTFERVSSIGGWCLDSAVSGDLVCLARGDTLVTLDAQDRTQPQHLGAITLGREVYGVELYGDLACALDEHGLRVVDISDPANPMLLGSVAGLKGSSLAVTNDYAYVAGYQYGFQIIDISNPLQPMPVALYHPEFWTALDVALTGDLACVAGSFSRDTGEQAGLWLFDISDPEQPSPVGKLDSEVILRGVAVSGNHAFLGADDARFLTVDLSTPASPSITGSLAVSRAIESVAIKDHIALATVGSDGLAIIDISHLDQPSLLETAPIRRGADRVTISEDHAFVSSYDDGLTLLDVSIPTMPSTCSVYRTIADPWGIAVSEGHVSVADVGCGVYFFDATTPQRPTPTAIYSGPDGDSSCMGITGIGDRVYAAAITDGMFIFDTRTPTSPSLLGSYYHSAMVVDRVAASEAYAFMCTRYPRLNVVDPTDPGDPVIVGQLRLFGACTGADLYRNQLHIAKGTRGLSIIDVADPLNPWEVGGVSGTTCNDVAAFGYYALLASAGENTLVILNTQDPSSPVPMASYKHENASASQVAFANGYAFLACRENGLIVVDVTDPYQPSFAGQYIDTHSYRTVAVDGRNVYLGSSTGGITILETDYLSGDIALPVSGNIRVLFRSKEAGFENDIWLDLPERQFIFTSHDANIGKSYDVGFYSEGTLLGFALENPSGWDFYTDSTRNVDNGAVHAIVRPLGPSAWEIYWEDSVRLSDRDFDDVVMEVHLLD